MVLGHGHDVRMTLPVSIMVSLLVVFSFRQQQEGSV